MCKCAPSVPSIHFCVVSHVQNLFVPGRCFIRDGVVMKICRKGPKKRHFFLFDDILVRVHTVPNRPNVL